MKLTILMTILLSASMASANKVSRPSKTANAEIKVSSVESKLESNNLKIEKFQGKNLKDVATDIVKFSKKKGNEDFQTAVAFHMNDNREKGFISPTFENKKKKSQLNEAKTAYASILAKLATTKDANTRKRLQKILDDTVAATKISGNLYNNLYITLEDLKTTDLLNDAAKEMSAAELIQALIDCTV